MAEINATRMQRRKEADKQYRKDYFKTRPSHGIARQANGLKAAEYTEPVIEHQIDERSLLFCLLRQEEGALRSSRSPGGKPSLPAYWSDCATIARYTSIDDVLMRYRQSHIGARQILLSNWRMTPRSRSRARPRSCLAPFPWSATVPSAQSALAMRL